MSAISDSIATELVELIDSAIRATETYRLSSTDIGKSVYLDGVVDGLREARDIVVMNT